MAVFERMAVGLNYLTRGSDLDLLGVITLMR